MRDPLRLAALAALVSVGAQIAYPLSGGTARQVVTTTVVVALAVAAVIGAVARLGALRGAAAVAGIVLAALGFEVLGVHTGVPFGSYVYVSTPGPRVAGVPLLVGLAWLMMAWPSAVVAARVVHGRVARVLLGAWALAAWDLFLDPQLVTAGSWRWTAVGAHLPGVPDVPLSNLGGWVLCGLVVSAGLQALLSTAAPVRTDVVAGGIYLWTWIGSTVALAVFLHLPAAAAWGALGMGLVGLLALLPRTRPRVSIRVPAAAISPSP